MNESIKVTASAEHIGFCADIHGHYERVLTMRERRPDIGYWFCAGDVTDMHKALYYNQPTLRLMHRLGIPSVLGNHDYYIKEKYLRRLDEEASAYLSSLPFNLTIQFGGKQIRIYHATPGSRDDFISEKAGEKTYLSLFGEEEADIIVLGHTHEPYVKSYGEKQFINPGALGVSGVRPSFCVLDQGGAVEFLYLDAE